MSFFTACGCDEINRLEVHKTTKLSSLPRVQGRGCGDCTLPSLPCAYVGCITKEMSCINLKFIRDYSHCLQHACPFHTYKQICVNSQTCSLGKGFNALQVTILQRCSLLTLHHAHHQPKMHTLYSTLENSYLAFWFHTLLTA